MDEEQLRRPAVPSASQQLGHARLARIEGRRQSSVSAVAAPADDQHARLAGAEADRGRSPIRTWPLASVAWPHKRDLGRRREPAQLVIGIAARVRDREGGLAEIVLHRDRLQHLVGQPCVERHHRGRIAGERPVGEGVDLDEAQARSFGGSAPWCSSVSAQRVAGMVDLAFGIEVDEDLAAGKLALRARPRSPPSPHARRRRVIAGSTQMWNWANSCAPLRAGAKVVDALRLRDGARRRRGSAGASPPAIRGPSAGRSPGSRRARRPRAATRRWRCRTAGSAPVRPRYWSSTRAAITDRLSSRSL